MNNYIIINKKLVNELDKIKREKEKGKRVYKNEIEGRFLNG